MNIDNLSIAFYKSTNQQPNNNLLNFPFYSSSYGSAASTPTKVESGPFNTCDPFKYNNNCITHNYVRTNFKNGDFGTYIKLKDHNLGRNLWLYDTKDHHLYFTENNIPIGTLRRPEVWRLPNRLGLPSKQVSRQPALFYILYSGGLSREPTFVLYKHVGFGNQELLYLVYTERNGIPYAKWTQDPFEATIFKYDPIKWSDYITQNLSAKYFHTS